MSNPLVATPTLIYVIVKDRDDFDKIARPPTDHGCQTSGQVLSKTVDQDGVHVVFQHWI